MKPGILLERITEFSNKGNTEVLPVSFKVRHHLPQDNGAEWVVQKKEQVVFGEDVLRRIGAVYSEAFCGNAVLSQVGSGLPAKIRRIVDANQMRKRVFRCDNERTALSTSNVNKPVLCRVDSGFFYCPMNACGWAGFITDSVSIVG